MKRALLVFLIALSGCCSGPEFMALAYDANVAVETRTTYALVSTVLEDPKVWAYGQPPERVAARETAYRPKLTRTPGRNAVGPISATTGDLAAAFAAADAALKELGYVPVAEGATEDFVLALSLSWFDDGRLARVAVQVGAEVDGRFDPHGISVAGVLAQDDACEDTAAELTSRLVSFLPAQGEEEP